MGKVDKPDLPVLAIDLGGTKIIAAIISSNVEILARDYHLTLASKGPQAVIDRVIACIDQLLGKNNVELSQISSISIAAAGAVDSSRGLVTSSPHLPGFDDVPLRDIVKEKCGVNTFLLNDASAAALGEHRFGAGKGVKNLIYLTVSTGIGGGIIIDRKLYLGLSGTAGEVGHMTIKVNGPGCSCGNKGCWEQLASGTALAREAVRRIRQGEVSSLTEMVRGKLENITAEKVSVAAQGGDPLALEAISEVAYYLGVGLANLVNIFNPEMIIIGGGMAKTGELLLKPAREVVLKRAFRLPAQAVSIVPSQLGDDAGVIGAAVFALKDRKSKLELSDYLQ